MKRSLDTSLLLCLALLCFFAWRLALNGGISYYLTFLVPLAIIFTILWVVRILQSRAVPDKSISRIHLYLSAFIVSVFSACIIYTAIPYHGVLASYIDEWQHTTSITLKNRNIFSNGLQENLTDIQSQLNLEDPIYATKLYLTIMGDGSILSLSGAMISVDSNQTVHSRYLLFDSWNGDTLKVWESDTNDTYPSDDHLLAPFYQLVQLTNLTQIMTANKKYTIHYIGKKTFSANDTIKIVTDETATHTEAEVTQALKAGTAITGYAMSITENSDSSGTTYVVLNPTYQSPQAKQQGETAAATRQALTDKWTISTDGDMYTSVPQSTLTYRLHVTGAATGSRWYSLEQSDDGGSSWTTRNGDPFHQKSGVAEGIQFFDNQLGFIAIQGASGSHSELFRTVDGGTTFTQVELPLDTITTLPKKAQELNLTIADFDYINFPIKNSNGELTVSLSTEQYEQVALTFLSGDGGKTWTYLQ